jgi:pimeloyl-ACP methyl ester carboxylesterase
MSPLHRTGTIASGDVTLFYRHFGAPGGTPVLIFHGANYYDSGDWIDVAAALARDREVVAWDTRGFGESSWSGSKDYSYDAIMADANALISHFGWRKVVLIGHSLGGSYALIFATHFAQCAAGLILVDHCPGRANAAAVSVNNSPKVFPTIEAALAETSREKSIARGTPAWARLAAIFKAVDGGFVFRRDPDYGNRAPVGPAAWTTKLKPTDTWSELAEVRSPVLILRGTRSDRYTTEALARVKNDFPQVSLVDVDAGHDIAGGAPETLIRLVSGFLAERIDAEKAA